LIHAFIILRERLALLERQEESRQQELEGLLGLLEQRL
jgi:hypothetical protein